MNSLSPLVVFRLDNRRYAIVLRCVERVVSVIDITPLPKAPEIVLGVINASGHILPVVDMRLRLRLPRRGIVISDQLIIARMAERTVALLVDSVDGPLEAPDGQIITTGQVLPGLPALAGVVKLSDDLIVIHDLDRFLSLDEAQTLDAALPRT